jgi:cobalamin biosynthesis protein CobD/CbiB
MRKCSAFLSAFFSLLISTSLPAQCAMCKAVVESGDVGMAEGVNSGITYLMVFPYILVGLLLFFIYRHNKTAKN